MRIKVTSDAWSVPHGGKLSLPDADGFVFCDGGSHDWHFARIIDRRFKGRRLRLTFCFRPMPACSTDLYINHSGGVDVCHIRKQGSVRDRGITEALRAMLSGSRDVGPWLRRVHRSGSSGGWHHFLTDRDLAFFNGVFEPFLRRFDYPFERTIATERPPRAIGSHYVERLIDEACNWFNQIETTGKRLEAPGTKM